MLFGCSKSKSHTVAIAILYGNHANKANYEMPTLNFEQGDIDETNLPFLHEKYDLVGLCGIIVDGNPTEYKSGEMEEILSNFNIAVENKRYKTAKNYSKDFLEKLYDKYADDEEVDTLESIFVATNYLKIFSNETEKRIVIIDSGLSTTGALDFLNNENLNDILKQEDDLSESQINSIIKNLDINKEIPDLSNIKILWYGLGEVGENQQELSKKQISNLELLWRKILEYSKASDIQFISLNKSNKSNNIDEKQLPMVSSILLNHEPIPFSEDSLGFKEDSAEFTDDSKENRIELLSSFRREGINQGLLIVGTTSAGKGNSNGIELSNQRAQAVKNELIELDVPPENIKTLGLGVKSHKYNASEFVNGIYYKDSEAAQSNRRVYIMSQDSEEAKLFQEDYEKIHK